MLWLNLWVCLMCKSHNIASGNMNWWQEMMHPYTFLKVLFCYFCLCRCFVCKYFKMSYSNNNKSFEFPPNLYRSLFFTRTVILFEILVVVWFKIFLKRGYCFKTNRCVRWILASFCFKWHKTYNILFSYLQITGSLFLCFRNRFYFNLNST